MKAIDEAIELCGGASKLAYALGVSVQRLSNWTERGVPRDYCHAVELATRGRVTVEQLRPDVPWLRVPDVQWPTTGGRPVIDVAATPAAA